MVKLDKILKGKGKVLNQSGLQHLIYVRTLEAIVLGCQMARYKELLWNFKIKQLFGTLRKSISKTHVQQ